jgi:SAM-dependent methyltransferase
MPSIPTQLQGRGEVSIFINKKVWNEFSEDELKDYEDAVFNHYRSTGFPFFDLTEEQRAKTFNQLVQFDTAKLELGGDELNQTMLALNLCNHHFPNIWEAKAQNFRSPLETFHDDEKFRIAIRKRIKHGDNMSDAGIRKVLSYSHGSQRVSNFKPTVAKYMYDRFAPNGDVLDFSCGYGGRLFGFLASSAKTYVGCEPNTATYTYLTEIALEYNSRKSVTINHLPIEDFETSQTFDLVFSSPPYFNTEKYCLEPTQSYLRYPTRQLWREGFLKPLVEKSLRYLRPQGTFAINIANVSSYPNLEQDTVELCEEAGFIHCRTLKMRLSKLMGAGFKHEPIFCFTKKKD